MFVGQREETVEEKIVRHYKETKSAMDGWENELQIAKKYQNEKDEKHCILMIQICKNTISDFEKIASENCIELSK